MYRLRDKTKQAALERVIPGFSGNLDFAARTGTRSCDHVVVGHHGFVVFVPLSEIIGPNEFNPDDWNNFPEVLPPDGVPMRVDTMRDGCGFKAQFIEGQWFDMRGDALFDGPYGDGIEGAVIRFRPWED